MKNNARRTSAREALGFHDEVREKLGLGPTQKLPLEGIEESRFLQSPWGLVETWVNPHSGRKGDRRHRTVVMCPKCNKQLSAGRLHQHMVVHLEQSPPSGAGTVVPWYETGTNAR